MTDTYGLNVYDSSGNLTFSLVDDIFRTVTEEEMSSAGSYGPYIISATNYKISSSEILCVVIPITTNTVPYVPSGVGVGTTILSGVSVKTFSINFSDPAGFTCNGNDVLTYGNCQMYILYGV